jgi:hypothetical protein
MKWFEVAVEGITPELVQADYWIVEDGFLIFCRNITGDERPDVAAFAPGWVYVKEVPGAERREDGGEEK